MTDDEHSMYSHITPETTKAVVDTYVDHVQVGRYPDANPLDQAIAAYIAQLRDALREACALAEAHIIVPNSNPDNKPAEISSWTPVTVADWTRPFRDKERIIELAKLAQVADQPAH
jgi:hypothetical protein